MIILTEEHKLPSPTENSKSYKFHPNQWLMLIRNTQTDNYPWLVYINYIWWISWIIANQIRCKKEWKQTFIHHCGTMFSLSIDILKYIIYGLAAGFFVFGVLLLVEGFFTTGAIRDLYGEFKITACGRCLTAFVRPNVGWIRRWLTEYVRSIKDLVLQKEVVDNSK